MKRILVAVLVFLPILSRAQVVYDTLKYNKVQVDTAISSSYRISTKHSNSDLDTSLSFASHIASGFSNIKVDSVLHGYLGYRERVLGKGLYGDSIAGFDEPFLYQTHTLGQSENNYNIRSRYIIRYGLGDTTSQQWRIGGVLGEVLIDTLNAGNVGDAVGVYGYAQNYGSGYVGRLLGYLTYVAHRSPGIVAEAAGLDATIRNEQNGTIGLSYGVIVRSPFVPGSGLIQNNYGVFIADQSNSNIATNYSLYQAGIIPNHFEGDFEMSGGRTIHSQSDTSYIRMSGGVTDTTGASLELYGYKYANNGSARLDIGGRPDSIAGLTNTWFRIFRASDHTATQVFEVDKSGNVTATGNVSGANTVGVIDSVNSFSAGVRKAVSVPGNLPGDHWQVSWLLTSDTGTLNGGNIWAYSKNDSVIVRCSSSSSEQFLIRRLK